jgi:hypothetical protein
MLDNTLTLSVDTLNNDSPTDEVYTRFDELLNRSVYHSEDHTYSVRDTLNFYRTLPKRAGNSLGVRKSAIKFTQDQEVTGVDSTTTFVQPALLDIAFNLPVGTTPAAAMLLRQRAIALLDDDTFIMSLTEDLNY